jgi:RsiW-degrading membrane proteinase PrsW (M82 family)
LSDFTFGLGIFLFFLGGTLIGFGFYLRKKIAPLHVMPYFMAVFAFLIGALILLYPDNFEKILV